MKPSTSTLALGLGLALSLAAPAQRAFADEVNEQVLLERANYWRGQHRLDLAAQILERVLALNAQQPDALYQSGVVAAERGDPAQAQRFFDLLRHQAATGSPRAKELASFGTATLSVASADSDDLIASQPSARTLAIPPHTPVAVAPVPRGLQLASIETATASDVEPAVPGKAPVSVSPGKSAARAGTDKPTQIAQVELMPPPPVGGYQRPVTPISYTADDSLEAQIDRSLAQVAAQTNPTLIAGTGLRVHGGSSGLDRLTEVGGSIEGSFSPWLTGTARFAVLPVWLDAGSVSTEKLIQFGANPILGATGAPLVASGGQDAFGVGLLGGYSYEDFSLQFGTTPLGFPVTNLIGTATYAPKFWDNTLTLRFEAARQPVIDSVLSYAGTHASLGAANGATNGAFGTNATWGGVVKTGGHFTVFYDDNYFGAYGGAGVATLTGTNVAANNVIDALAGTYFRPWKGDDWAIRVGVSLFYTSFNRNLGGFTFGQGGYFSPQNYEALTFPIEYTGHSGRWSYLASGAVGLQHFNADSSPIFPKNPFAQTALANTPGAVSIIGGTSSTGPAFNFRGQLEYAIDDSLAIGASASLDNSKSYTEGIAKLYLRKTFEWFGTSPAADDPASIVDRDQPRTHL